MNKNIVTLHSGDFHVVDSERSNKPLEMPKFRKAFTLLNRDFTIMLAHEHEEALDIFCNLLNVGFNWADSQELAVKHEMHRELNIRQAMVPHEDLSGEQDLAKLKPLFYYTTMKELTEYAKPILLLTNPEIL